MNTVLALTQTQTEVPRLPEDKLHLLVGLNAERYAAEMNGQLVTV